MNNKSNYTMRSVNFVNIGGTHNNNILKKSKNENKQTLYAQRLQVHE